MSKQTKLANKKPSSPEKEKNFENRMGELAIDPSINASTIIKQYSFPSGDVTLAGLTKSLSNAMQEIKEGNLETCENILLNQACALESIFVTLSKRAVIQENDKILERLLRLALKAQNQCRTTIETLANIKNPPVVYAKQANIAQGHQQVNNSTEK